MNERMRELAKQTGYIWHASGDPQIYEFTPEKLEKFAELIVRECAEICDAYGMPDGTSQTAMVLSRAIKQHFGVK